MHNDHSSTDSNVIQLPASTVWPMIMALGVSLILAGMVTNIVIGLLGLLLTIAGAVGWFFQVLPFEAHEPVPVDVEQVTLATTRTLGNRGRVAADHREVLPVEKFRFVTGLEGGIAGGFAMTIPATIFSLIRYHSIWYAMNLLAAGGFVSWASASDAFLSQFHLQGLLAALAIHGFTSLLVGLLYGAMLPMFPRYPIFTAGFISPLLVTGILYSALNIVSPILNARIDWFWFVISQIAFGLVCGFVVNLQAKVRTPQFQALPFSVRAGIHSDLGDRTLEDARNSDDKDSSQ